MTKYQNAKTRAHVTPFQSSLEYLELSDFSRANLDDMVHPSIVKEQTTNTVHFLPFHYVEDTLLTMDLAMVQHTIKSNIPMLIYVRVALKASVEHFR